MSANIYTIAAGTAFADALARGVIERTARDPLVLADVTIFVPTRRAIRTLGESFSRQMGGAALLPQIRALGDVDDDEMFFDPAFDEFSLPAAIDPVRRRLLLANLVQRWDHAAHDGRSTFGFAQAASLARGLAQFIDEAETQGADLARLETLAETGMAAHWQHVRDFLCFIRDQWPALMAAEGAVNPAARRNAALQALAARYRNHPPEAPVIAAGTTGSIPATSALLSVIADLPNGAIVLPGLDRALDNESWETLDEGHAQFGVKQLLARMGVERHAVADWCADESLRGRAYLLRETLRPPPTTDAWLSISSAGIEEITAGLSGLSLIEAANPAEEAASIALVLRHALEEPRKTAALVTPDRNLARRVASELLRWKISIDDSAGRPLANTPIGAFLLLLVEAAREGFAPVALLSLLKHPLAAGGGETAQFRRQVRALERAVLRGPRPDAGLEGIARALEAARAQAKTPDDMGAINSLSEWFAKLSETLRPFADALTQPFMPLGELMRLHAGTAEALATTPDRAGHARLWSGQAGNAAALLLETLKEADKDLPAIEAASYPFLLRNLAEERAVRPAYGSHPRLAILGPLEARLQQFDVVVLGGLNEGTWPQSPPADPWLSRPMRKSLGLESPERRIGLAAHDFATLAANARVFLTRSLRADGAPTVASRWIERLRQLMGGLKLQDKLKSEVPYAAIASALQVSAQAPIPEKRPRPCPPVRTRPRGLSVTEIETWLRDPYAIYAKHVLRLKPLDALDEDFGAPEKGTAIHLALERFFKAFPAALPDDALARLLVMGEESFAEMAIPRATLAVWRPRFERAAAWVVDWARSRQALVARSHAEVSGRIEFQSPGGAFTLRGRADRIDLLASGGAAIFDYKTGAVPSAKQVSVLLSPQLPLLAMMLGKGGFAEIGPHHAAELAYLSLTGGPIPGKEQSLKANIEELIGRAAEAVAGRVVMFDDDHIPYLPRIAPFRATTSGDYDHLARVREWSLSGWDGEGE